jgi:O-antigen/teichoic acid export membrane protein
MRQFLQRDLHRQSAWVAGPYVVKQVLRLGTNIVLARLLVPEMFGLMLLVNTLRIGTELLSDIGIGQSVVRSPRGDDEAFVNVAWTLQVIRGLCLTIFGLCMAYPIAWIYDQPELVPILAAMSLLFLMTGLQSPGLFLMQRYLRVKDRALYDFAWTLVQCGLTIALALIIPSIWALVLGVLGSTLFTTILSYRVGPRVRPRLAWHSAHAREIFGFGKWIFLSTAVYFAAGSTDKMYFVAALPLALAGVYSIARTLADPFDQLGQRVGSMLIFPKIAALGEQRGAAAASLRTRRRSILALVALGIGCAMAVSDQMILLLYDARYHLAAFILPLLLVGAWFRVLGSFADAMLMGCSRAAPGALANSTKFAVLLVGLPLAVAQADLFTALLVLILADAARWAVLAPVLQRERLAAVVDDLALTAGLAATAVVLKLAVGALGLAPTVSEWWALGQALRG